MSFGKALDALRYAETLPTEIDPSRGPGKVFTLPLGSVVTLQNIFQHRGREDNEYDSARHVKSLSSALRIKPSGKRFLDPVLLINVDNAWICVDGHHRLEAYKMAEILDVPATAFQGTVGEAVLAAGAGNSKAKLPMTKRDRMNAAWKITAAGLGSRKQTVEAAGVADGTVAGMRRMKTALLVAGYEPANLSYSEAREIERDGELGERGEDWEEKQVARIENTLCKAFGTNVHRNREFIAQAIENRFPSLVETIIDRNALEHRETIESLFEDEDENHG